MPGRGPASCIARFSAAGWHGPAESSRSANRTDAPCWLYATTPRGCLDGCTDGRSSALTERSHAGLPPRYRDSGRLFARQPSARPARACGRAAPLETGATSLKCCSTPCIRSRTLLECPHSAPPRWTAEAPDGTRRHEPNPRRRALAAKVAPSQGFAILVVTDSVPAAPSGRAAWHPKQVPCSERLGSTRVQARRVGRRR